MLTVFYDSRTGNVRRFVKKLDPNEFQCIHLSEVKEVAQKGILITYTTGKGQVPKTTREFLNKYHPYITSVSVSGNRNWGDNYGKALDIIVEEYPLIQPGLKFELQGRQGDLIDFLNYYRSAK